MPRYKRKHKQVFTVFPKLPLEIQALIWDFCVPQRDIVKVQIPTGGRCYRNAVLNMRRLPHIARVCREARRAALRRQARRRPFTIVDVDRRPAPDEPHGAPARVLFDTASDVIYLSHVRGRPNTLHNRFGTVKVPHLSTLLSNRDVPVCIPTMIVGRFPRILGEMAGYGRRSFHLALGGEFVVHMPRGKALERGLFGHGADETTVMIDARNMEECAAYELAYDKMRRDHHGKLPFLIARSLSGWIQDYDGLRLGPLTALATKKVEEAWIRLQEQGKGEANGEVNEQAEGEGDEEKEDPLTGMPVPIPVIVFRLCVKCRHEKIRIP